MTTKDQPAQASGDSEEAVREKIARIVRAHVVEPYASELTDELAAALRHSQPSVQVEGVANVRLLEIIAGIDKALCNYVNACSDPFTPVSKWDDESRKNFKRLSDAYNEWHNFNTGLWQMTHRPATPDHAALVEALERARSYIEYALDNQGNDVAGNGLASLNAIDTALSTMSKAPQAGGEQWKLVPVEPTKEQVQAGSNATLEHFDFIQPGVAEAVYRAMVATTPSSRAEPVASVYCRHGLLAGNCRHCHASPLSSRAEVV